MNIPMINGQNSVFCMQRVGGMRSIKSSYLYLFTFITSQFTGNVQWVTTDLVITLSWWWCSVSVRYLLAAKELTSQQIPVVLKERQVQITEIFYVLNFHFQFLRGIPVDNLHHNHSVLSMYCKCTEYSAY